MRRNDKVVRWLALLVSIILLGNIVVSSNKAFGHDQYHDWKQPDNGGSCCNDNDCGRSRGFIHDDGLWRAWNPTTSEWVVVPVNKVMQGPSPDGRTHWCGVGQTTYCFWPGGPEM